MIYFHNLVLWNDFTFYKLTRCSEKHEMNVQVDKKKKTYKLKL